MTQFLIGLAIVAGGFILGYIIAPLCFIFDGEYALYLYIFSWVLLIAGALIGGEMLYEHTIGTIKEHVEKHYAEYRRRSH